MVEYIQSMNFPAYDPMSSFEMSQPVCRSFKLNIGELDEFSDCPPPDFIVVDDLALAPGLLELLERFFVYFLELYQLRATAGN